MRTRILVLTDERGTLDGLASALDSDGYEVAAQLSYEVALVAVTELHPQLIILDTNAGSESRWIEFMQVVWLVPALCDVRFLLTASVSQHIHAMEGVFHTKGIGVVYKPYRLEQLLDCVRMQMDTAAQRL